MQIAALRAHKHGRLALLARQKACRWGLCCLWHVDLPLPTAGAGNARALFLGAAGGEGLDRTKAMKILIPIPLDSVPNRLSRFSRKERKPCQAILLLVFRFPWAALRLPRAVSICSFRANSGNRIMGNSIFFSARL